MLRTDHALPFVAYALIGFAVFGALGAYVSTRTPTRLDIEAVALRGGATPVAAFFTTLGYWPALTVLSAIAVVAFSGSADRVWLPAALVASHALSQSAIVAIKPVFHRVRPDYWLVRREVDTSYPSGHAATAVTFYGALIVLVRHVALPHGVALVATAALAACVLGIPWSRLALGAHYLTDVTGGLLVGSAWLAASLAAYELFGR